MSPDEARMERRREYLELIDLLLDHYDIPKDHAQRWLRLAMALAEVHVPAFRIARPETRGRKRAWTFEDEKRLYWDVTDLVEKGQTVENACRLLAKWPAYRKRGMSEGALRRRYIKVKPVMGLLLPILPFSTR